MAVYMPMPFTNEIYGAISGIDQCLLIASIELTLDESNLAGYDNQDLYLVYDDVNGVLIFIMRMARRLHVLKKTSGLAIIIAGTMVVIVHYLISPTLTAHNTVCLYFFDEINTSFNTDDLINSLSVRRSEWDEGMEMDQPGETISDAIVGIGYIDSTTIELELSQYVIDNYMDEELWIEYDNENSVLTTDSGMDIGWFDSSFWS